MRNAIFVGLTAILAAGAADARQVVVTSGSQVSAAAEKSVQALLDKESQLAHFTFETRAVKGAPYSGEAVSESVQTLADGNRIVRRTVTRVYRDSEGRTRRETLGADGMTSIAIADPTTGVSYVLEPGSQKAFRSSVLTKTMVVSGKGGVATYGDPATHAEAGGAGVGAAGTGELKLHFSVSEAQGGVTTVKIAEDPAAAHNQTTKDDLGQQTIEGVVAEGGRTTTLLPAGAIGNEQPIKIVSEMWYSRELQLTVLTRHSDPRLGETTYRLSNIVRAEPDRSLFEVPAGYTVK